MCIFDGVQPMNIQLGWHNTRLWKMKCNNVPLFDKVQYSDKMKKHNQNRNSCEFISINLLPPCFFYFDRIFMPFIFFTFGETQLLMFVCSFCFLCFLHALRLFTANRLQWFLTHDFLIKNQFSEEYSSLWALRGDRLMTVTSIISSQRLVTPNTRMTMTDKDNEQSKYWRCGSGGH